MAGGSRRHANRDQTLIAIAGLPLFGIRVAVGQLESERSVVRIDIVKEVNVSVLFYDSRHVKDQYRNNWSKIDSQVVLALMHGLVDPFLIPTRGVAEEPCCELVGFLHVDAPMACDTF